MVNVAKFSWVQDQLAALQASVTAQVTDIINAAGSAATTDARAIFPMTKQLRTGSAAIVYMGDSKSEGTGVASTSLRAMNLLQAALRTKYSTADAGKGYIPAKYFTFYDLSDRPIITGTFATIDNEYGLGNRSIQMDLGSTVTFPAIPMVSTVPLMVSWSRAYGMGTMEVLTGGVVRATVGVEGAPESVTTAVTVPAGTADVVIRPKAGTAPIRVQGIFNATSLNGVKVIDATHSGSTFRDYSEGMIASGAPHSQEHHWAAVAAFNPCGVIMGFGANDQSVRTPEEVAGDALLAVANGKVAAPSAGFLLIFSTELTGRAGTGQVRLYESALRAAFKDDPKVTIMYESDLYLPTAGNDYTWGGPEGWLGDTVHMTAAAHAELARVLISKLT